MHLNMVRIRRFEETAGRMAENGKIPGALHLYVGEEAIAAGVMQHLSDEDQITSTHRGHGHLVAKGGEFKPMFAELFGRSTGYCGGKGGSMHVSNMKVGMLGANGIVGGGPPIAVGAAFSNKYRKTKNVAVAFLVMVHPMREASMKRPIWQRCTNCLVSLSVRTMVSENIRRRLITRRWLMLQTGPPGMACRV